MERKGTAPKNERGFVLIVVLWGLGLVMVLAASFGITMRSHTKATANRMINAQAEAYADAGVNLAILALIATRTPGAAPPAIPVNGARHLCRIAETTVLAITIEDEGGKIDLNGATPQLLAALFRGFDAEPSRLADITDALLDFRDGDNSKRANGAEADDYRAAGLPFGPRNGPFLAVEELEQVLGLGTGLYRKIRPFVTIHSRRSGIDPAVAPVKLLAALTGERPLASDMNARQIEHERADLEIPRPFVTPSERLAYTIRVEAHGAGGGLFVREAVAELPRTRHPPYVLRAWRRGDASPPLPDRSTKNLESCERRGPPR